MHRLIAVVPKSNVVMLRVCCDDCAHRVFTLKVSALGHDVVPTLHKVSGAGTRKCDVHPT